MIVAFRTDASRVIGSGHVMRCLTLADALTANGAGVLFLCREHAGNLIDLIEAKGYPVLRLPEPGGEYPGQAGDPVHAPWLGASWRDDAEASAALLAGRELDWLIVDHYALERRWEQFLRPQARRVMVIDDLADRNHDCDLLLDQNLYDQMAQRYQGLVPGGCRKLLGPSFALLRDEFIAARAQLRERTGMVRRILVFFGGSDPSNETEKALLALDSLERPDIAIDLVLGAANPHLERIRELCRPLPQVRLHIQTASMARLMLQADLFIGAGGSTTWERFFLGLPGVVWVIAENQLQTTLAVARLNLGVYLGWYHQVKVEEIAQAVAELLKDGARLKEMGERAMKLMDHRQEWIRQEMLT